MTDKIDPAMEKWRFSHQFEAYTVSGLRESVVRVSDLEAFMAGKRIVDRATPGTVADLLSLIARLESMEGCNLVSDDGGLWAVSTSGMQPVPEDGGFRETVTIASFINPGEWKPTIQEALLHFFASLDEDDDAAPSDTEVSNG